MKYRKLLIILSIATLTLTGCGAKITQTADTLTVEAGTELNFQTADFFTASKENALSELVVDTTKVDTNTVGTYEITVTYKKDLYKVTANVQDTTAPEIILKEELPKPELDTTIKASDFVDITDISESTVYFVEKNENLEETLFTVENDSLKIIAIDVHGNESEKLNLELDIYPELALTTMERSKNGDYTITEEWINAVNKHTNNWAKDGTDEDMAVFAKILEAMTPDPAMGEEIYEQLMNFKKLFPSLGYYMHGASWATNPENPTYTPPKQTPKSSQNTQPEPPAPSGGGTAGSMDHLFPDAGESDLAGATSNWQDSDHSGIKLN